MLTSVQDFHHCPKRIISLVPSITELLSYLGLGIETIAITKFCVHPEEWHKTKNRIGGTKNINIDKIKSLIPDLIICSKEENVKEQIEILANDYPVFMTDVCTYKDALEMIENIGCIVHKRTLAEELVCKIEANFKEIKLPLASLKTAAYIIWKEPYMTIGGDTYINEMMRKAGFKNVFEDKLRYPVITVADLQALDPNLILLSSEPYPFRDKHIKELHEYLPKTIIRLVDGEIFSWYGSRMLYAPHYFFSLQNQISTI